MYIWTLVFALLLQGDEENSEFALDGLKQVMAVKSRVVLPYLIPQVCLLNTVTHQVSVIVNQKPRDCQMFCSHFFHQTLLNIIFTFLSVNLCPEVSFYCILYIAMQSTSLCD